MINFSEIESSIKIVRKWVIMLVLNIIYWVTMFGMVIPNLISAKSTIAVIIGIGAGLLGFYFAVSLILLSIKLGIPSEKKSSGFTLIELMIVVAIIAIITAVMLPAMADQVIKDKVRKGKSLTADQMNRYAEMKRTGETAVGISVNIQSNPTIPGNAVMITDMGNGWEKYQIDGVWFMTDGKQTTKM